MRNVALTFSLILFIACFWPVGVMAQPQPKSECSISGLEVINLAYEDALAIQGIVKQDVASSADEYNRQKALDDLGVSTQNSQQKTVDKYGLYFMGPDGVVNYAEKLNNRLSERQKGWLMDTTIFGRVEYGAKLAENVLLCPQLPEGSSGVCFNETGGSAGKFTVNDNLSAWGFVAGADQSASLGSGWIDFTQILPGRNSEDDAWDSFTISGSRMIAQSFRSSVSTQPSTGRLFVLPRTYLYFTNRMKKLALWDTMSQFTFMAVGMFQIAKSIHSAYNAKGFTRAADMDEYQRIINNFMADGDVVALEKAIGTALKDITGNPAQAQKLAKLLGASDDLASGLLKNFDDIDDVGMGLIKNADNADDLFRQGELFADAPKELKEAIRNYKKLSIATTEVNEYVKALGYVDNPELLKSFPSDQIDKYTDLVHNPPKIDPNDLRTTLKGVQKMGTGYKLGRSTDEATEGLWQLTKYSDDGLTKLGSATLKAEGKGVTGFVDALRQVSTGKISLGSLSKSKMSLWLVGGKALQLGVRLPAALLKTLYTVNRRITLIAYGLHNLGRLAQKGFLEVSSAGLTLEWNKDTVSSPGFQESSFILLYGTDSDRMSYLTQGQAGSFFADDVATFLAPMGMAPMVASKYSKLGNDLIFGGLLYNDYPQFIKVEKEKPTGLTTFTQQNDGYSMSFGNWENKADVIIEDPNSMKELGSKVVTTVGMRTENVDVYAHVFDKPNAVKDVFPFTQQFVEKITDWGVHTNLLTAGTFAYWIPGGVGLRGMITAPLVLSQVSKGFSQAGKEVLTAKTTSMKDLEKNYQTGNLNKKSCEEIESRCEAEIGAWSLYLSVSGSIQSIPAVGLWGLPLGIADYFVLEGVGENGEGQMERIHSCTQDLLECQEKSFIILGGATYEDPSIIKAQQEEATSLTNLPSLEDLDVDGFIESASQQLNLTADDLKMGQMQTNIHTEMEHASGRLKMSEIYYAHIKDATIDFLGSDLGINMCPVNGGTAQNENCVDVQGNSLLLGGNEIVNSVLVPFKWMDEELPALVIPNTVIAAPTEGTCELFNVDYDIENGRNINTRINFHPDVESLFKEQGFEDLDRMMGELRVINTNKGAIYPTLDTNGNLYLQMDRDTGAFQTDNKTVKVTQEGKLFFKGNEYGFESAVFAGGTIIKKGSKIYIVPRYFKPTMSGKDWLSKTKGTPLVSDTGENLDYYDDQGNIIGIDAAKTRIPGGEKLGVLTTLSAEKDLNGDGKISEDEQSGWKFYTDENNDTKFELSYNGQKELYDSDQIEVDEETGQISVYEKGKDHVEANLLRSLETKVDSLGRTLFTVKDGDGNTLLEEALVTYLKGTNGAIHYDSANNNYVFVNGQPVEVNNDFKTNGFNAVTGRPEPPLLQPSAVTEQGAQAPEEVESALPAVPIRPEGFGLILYLITILSAILFVYTRRSK